MKVHTETDFADAMARLSEAEFVSEQEQAAAWDALKVMIRELELRALEAEAWKQEVSKLLEEWATAYKELWVLGPGVPVPESYPERRRLTAAEAAIRRALHPEEQPVVDTARVIEVADSKYPPLYLRIPHEGGVQYAYVYAGPIWHDLADALLDRHNESIAADAAAIGEAMWKAGLRP